MDGPAASGKSSVAKKVAAQLGWLYVNTGNMYRAATLAVINAGVDYKDENAVLETFAGANFEVTVEQGRSVILVDGKDLESELNSEAVNLAVSHVAKLPPIRERLVALQRDLGKTYPSVMEGRDIGTVVFPDAPYKFYIDASEEVRAQRRGLQGQADSVKERDRMDSTRETAPLMAASDAVLIDSSELSLEDVVSRVMEVLQQRDLVPAA